ncbi:MAG: ABC transporter ATP-binding protein [Polyangiaceae bacterium]|nr:ABC transporter ATP-binding protein [Polyangiaceae bacterium]
MSTLLSARGARIHVDEAVAIGELNLETRGQRLVLTGNTGPLVSALTGIPQGVAEAALHAATYGELALVPGRARAVSGELRLAGHDVVAGAHLPHVGAAPFDPPLPPEWTVETYVTQTARLAMAARIESFSRTEVAQRAMDAISRLGLSTAKKKGLRSLHPAERRVMVLAAAVASGPAVLVADRPLAGLDGQAAQFVFGALEAAASDRGLVVSVAQVAPGTTEGTFARSASDFAAFVAGELSLFGPPASVLGERRVFRLTIRSNADALRSSLEQRGAALSGGPTHFTLQLADGQDPSFVLGLASEVRSAVVEIVPVV